jgi:hypothetical protein
VVAETVGLFDEGIQYAMDYDYWIRLDRAGFALQYVPVTLAQSRLHADAKTISARPKIFREILLVSRRGGGYVSANYIQGLWRHLAYERPDHPARFLRKTPRARACVAYVHYWWLNRHRYTWTQRLGGAYQALRRRLIRLLLHVPWMLALLVHAKRSIRGIVADVKRFFARSSAPAARRAAPQRVVGFWPDNWIEDELAVVVAPREETRELRIVGRPVVGMTVHVSSGGGPLGRFELVGGREEAVVVRLPPGPRETVSYRFSDGVVDGAGRTVSFRLDETNLFGEQDLGARE